jgi:hypothetical protein
MGGLAKGRGGEAERRGKEAMNTSEQINEIAAALAKAQGQIQPAAKDKTNPAFRSRYADLTSIWEACRAPLTENGIAVVQMPVDSTDGRVALVTTLLHSSGQFISSMVSTRLVKDDPQGVGSALTYLRRYSLAAMVGVVADEDDDGNAASGRGAPPVQQRSEPRSQKSEARTQEPKSEAINGMTLEQAEARFAAKYGQWGKHYTLPKPTTVQGWINAGQELRDRLQREDVEALESQTAPK